MLNLLINAGSRSATAASLAYYTTLTNQTPEGTASTNTVDIGFHYNVFPIRPGFDQSFLIPNDDNEYVTNLLATLPFTINFFGSTYSTLYVNNNGNVTFTESLDTYTPDVLVNLGKDIIAPFWADVDTRACGSDVVRFGTGTVNGRTAFGANWVGVGYFESHADKLNSFQLVLIDRSDRASDDYDVEFNYAQIQWEAGDVSGGSGGLWGGGDIDADHSPARAGYANSNGSTFELNGSAVPGALLDSNSTTGLVYNSFNSTVPGRYVFQFHNGVPVGHP